MHLLLYSATPVYRWICWVMEKEGQIKYARDWWGSFSLKDVE